MTTTFKKRQKEMKRQDKARSKAEKRLQKKTEPGVEVVGNDGIAWEEDIAERARLDLEAFDEAMKAETQQ
ncbi:MAG: hypothetical protein ABSD87_11050 [Candidatus Acidiferrales bacterium]|jgi:hypothetical protein